MEPQYRIGLGHDVHRLIEGRPLILGGVEIAFEMGLDGHSDADVLLHAIIDALLGAAGLGDIGEWFPNTDERWADADSRQLLAEVLTEVLNSWEIVNLDCTISAERPRMKDHKPVIRQSLARLLKIDESRINVKAKSGEKVGPIGRGEAMSADAIVMLKRRDEIVHAV